MEPWFWEKLCRALDCEHYAAHQFDPARHEEMFAFLRGRFREKTRDAWFAELKEKDVCATPVYGLDEALADANTRERGMIVWVEHPEHGRIPQIGVAPKFSETPGRVRTLAPRPGQHTEEVLREAGFSDAEIAGVLGEAGD
jgi:crotonobetainyl-CoA:carnitine CoA-transferase CaiB-like acyl-CoA transferase